MNFTEHTQNSEVLYQGRILTLYEDSVLLPNGREALREVVRHPGGVCVAALTAQREFLFVRQFRYPYGEELLELPAGKIDRKDEHPLACGKRELLEETGAAAKEYRSLGRMFPSPGYTDEIIHLFLAWDLTYSQQTPDEDEFLDVVKIPADEAQRMVMSGELADAKTQIAVLKACAILQAGEIPL